ncbi:hypothetical protein LP419_13675 [Massilia sp. H-1]|nr:hypothetical protein LP419_13675 [Massilia sp. H-1]
MLPAAILLLGAVTDIDLWLAACMASDGPVAFPLRHAWFAETLSHKFVRSLMIVLGLCAVLPVLYDLWRPRAGWTARFRLRLRVVALSAVLVPSVVSIMKRLSFSHCPWDMAKLWRRAALRAPARFGDRGRTGRALHAGWGTRRPNCGWCRWPCSGCPSIRARRRSWARLCCCSAS